MQEHLRLLPDDKCRPPVSLDPDRPGGCGVAGALTHTKDKRFPMQGILESPCRDADQRIKGIDRNQGIFGRREGTLPAKNFENGFSGKNGQPDPVRPAQNQRQIGEGVVETIPEHAAERDFPNSFTDQKIKTLFGIRIGLPRHVPDLAPGLLPAPGQGFFCDGIEISDHPLWGSTQGTQAIRASIGRHKENGPFIEKPIKKFVPGRFATTETTALMPRSPAEGVS